MTNIKPNQSLNFPGVEDRVELESPIKTEHEHYTEDTLADPEGAERRSMKDQLEFPEWVYNNFMLSPKTYYGKAWPDGGKHLTPRVNVIKEIMDVHTASMQKEPLEGCMEMGLKMSNFDEIKQAYLQLIDVSPQSMQFDIMNGLGNSVERALARRAISKQRYLEAADRTGTKEDYLSDLYGYAMRDAETAGALLWIHRDCWRSLQWKSEPKYMRVENSVILEQINAAKRIEEKFGTARNVKQAATSDYAKTMMMF
jgi:hypothetical protein